MMEGNAIAPADALINLLGRRSGQTARNHSLKLCSTLHSASCAVASVMHSRKY